MPSLPKFAFIFVGLTLFLVGVAAAADKPVKPNIVFILVDSLRADHMSCYGYPRPTTSFVDTLAAEGVRFDQYFAPSSWTAPSIMSLNTGLSPVRHGTTAVGQAPRDEFPTLAGVLREAGYYTLGVTCSRVSGAANGYGRGFDLYDDYSIGLELDNRALAASGDSGGDPEHRGLVAKMDDRLVNLTLRHMRRVAKDRPYFLYVQLYDPHWDYLPTPEYAKLFADPDYKGNAAGRFYKTEEGSQFKDEADLRHFLNLYLAEIRQTDDAVKRLVATLRERGQLKDTDLLVVTSDHGEEFMEHGVLSHGKNLFETTVHIPLILVAPAWLPKGVVSETMSSHLDWLPTMATLAGAPAPEDLPGTDLLAFEDGQWTPPERDAVFLHVALKEAKARPMVAVRTATAKVIRHLDNNETMAYDLKADPGEQKPLPVAGNPEYEPLLARLDHWYTAEQKLAGLE